MKYTHVVEFLGRYGRMSFQMSFNSESHIDNYIKAMERKGYTFDEIYTID